jgi:hypothetical protein
MGGDIAERENLTLRELSLVSVVQTALLLLKDRW